MKLVATYSAVEYSVGVVNSATGSLVVHFAVESSCFDSNEQMPAFHNLLVADMAKAGLYCTCWALMESGVEVAAIAAAVAVDYCTLDFVFAGVLGSVLEAHCVVGSSGSFANAVVDLALACFPASN